MQADRREPGEPGAAPPPRRRWLPAALGVGLAVVAAGGGWWWWQQRVPAPAAAPEVVAAAPAPAPVVAPPAAPAIAHPVEAIELPPAGAASAAGDAVADALTALLGREAVLSFVQTDDFARRFVATVDSLDRTHAPSALWPLAPARGRFAVVEGSDGLQAAPANPARYAPVVGMLAGIDTAQAVVLYVRWYPRLQRAYEELGYPGRYFNDRLVAVIDHLLAAPDAPQPLALRLTEVRGPIAATRPWVRYEYADPALEACSAGQKILLRVGPTHARALKAKLAALRARLASRSPAR